MPTTERQGNKQDPLADEDRVFMSSPWVGGIVTAVSRWFARRYDGVGFDSWHMREELEQACWLHIARDRTLRVHEDTDKGREDLFHGLRSDLANEYEPRVKRILLTESYEARYDESDVLPRARVTLHPEPVEHYTPELVERLLPSLWSPQGWGMQCENAPDADMPRGMRPRSTGGTGAAMVADIRRAWQTAGLTIPQQRVLLLRYGLDYTFKDVARVLGVTEATVKEQANGRVNKRGRFTGGAIGKLVSTLNGHGAEVIHLADIRRDVAVAA